MDEWDGVLAFLLCFVGFGEGGGAGRFKIPFDFSIPGGRKSCMMKNGVFGTRWILGILLYIFRDVSTGCGAQR